MRIERCASTTSRERSIGHFHGLGHVDLATAQPVCATVVDDGNCHGGSDGHLLASAISVSSPMRARSAVLSNGDALMLSTLFHPPVGAYVLVMVRSAEHQSGAELI